MCHLPCEPSTASHGTFCSQRNAVTSEEERASEVTPIRTDADGRGVRDQGATTVEYAIILSLIAAVIFLSVVALGQTALGFFTTAKGLFP